MFRCESSYFRVSSFSLPGHKPQLTIEFREYVLHKLDCIIPTYPEFRIIPQAVSVRHGLAVGARCAPFVLATMYIFCSSYSVSVRYSGS